MYIKCDINIKMQDAEVVGNVFRSVLKNECEIDQQKEHFWVMGLTVKNKIIYIELVSLGSLTEGIVHPREVFRSAIFKGVACLIFCHNHPSGEAEPSPQDITVTNTLKEGGKILGIKILDHIIISDGELYSFAREGLI